MTQLHQTLPEDQEERLFVFDSGGYCQENVKRYNEAKIPWLSRVPETSVEAKTVLQEDSTAWQPLSDHSGQYRTCVMDLPQGKERWIIVRTEAREKAARLQMEKRVNKAQEQWKKKLWHLSKQEFACQSDAEMAWKHAMRKKPSFLVLTCTYQEEGRYAQKGRPKKDALPDSTVWHVKATLSVDQQDVEVQIRKQACFILATNVLDEQKLSNNQAYLTYKDQGGAERGFSFSQRSTFFGLVHFR